MDLMEQGTDRGDLPNQNPGDTSAPQGPNEQSSQDDNNSEEGISNTTSEDGMEVSPDASQGPTTQHAVNDNNSQDNNMEADQSASQGPTTQLTENDNTAGSLEINKEADHSAPQGPTKQLTENDNSSREKKRDDNHSAHQASAFQDSEEGISNNSEDNNMETEQSAPQGPTTQHAEDVNSFQKKERDDNHSAHQASAFQDSEEGISNNSEDNNMETEQSASQGPTTQHAEDVNSQQKIEIDNHPAHQGSNEPNEQSSQDNNTAGSSENNTEADQSAPQEPATQLTENDNSSSENNRAADHSAPQGPTTQPTEGDNMLWKRFFVQVEGKTNGAHQDFVTKLQLAGCIEVKSVKESDILLVFCPIVSRVGTDISDALENIPDDKPTILVVMHPTFKPDHVVANSRRLVEKENIKLTVDCLFYNGKLLICDRNDTAWTEIKRFLNLSSPQASTTNINVAVAQDKKPGKHSDPKTSALHHSKKNISNNAAAPEDWVEFSSDAIQGLTRQPTENDNMLWKRFFVQVEGKTNGAHQDFVTRLQLAGCIKVESDEESDILLVFCPIVSRVGTDISDALENIPDDKPTILVVMHPTFKTDQVVANSRKLVEKENIKLTVDCLFYDGKLLNCDRNDTAWTEIKRFLNLSSPQASTTNINVAVAQDKKPGKHSDPKVSTSKSNKGDDSNSSKKKFFVQVEGKMNGAHENFVTRLKDIGHIKVESLEESEILLFFCLITRAEMDIRNALENIPDGKQTILVMMHLNFNPDKVVVDSRKLVKILSTDKKNVKLTVDCLFHDGKLLSCDRNEKAWASIRVLVGVPPSESFLNAMQSRFSSLKPKWFK